MTKFKKSKVELHNNYGKKYICDTLICINTCEKDASELNYLKKSDFYQKLKNTDGIGIIEVYRGVTKTKFESGKLFLEGDESYDQLHIKTYQMINWCVRNLTFKRLVKLDCNFLTYTNVGERTRKKICGVEKVENTIYKKKLKQYFGSNGRPFLYRDLKAWLNERGIILDLNQPNWLEDGMNYYCGKCYRIDYEVARFIAHSNKSKFILNQHNIQDNNGQFPFAVEDVMVGRMYKEYQKSKCKEKMFTEHQKTKSSGDSTKKLLYFSHFLNPNYLKIIELLVRSISKSNVNEVCDILVITEQKFEQEIINIFLKYNINIKTLILEPVFKNINESNEERKNHIRILDAAQMRMRLFEWEHIDDYKNILYIDTDVLIDGNVSKVFDVLEKDVVYGLQEGTTASEYFGRSLFPHRRKDWPVPYRTPTFSTGVMVFYNSPSIKELFVKTLKHIKEYVYSDKNLPSCMEQPFLVYNAIIDKKYNETKLIGIVKNNPNADDINSEIVIFHFPRPIGDFYKKYTRMNNFLN